MPEGSKVRIAAVADLHYSKTSQPEVLSVLGQAAREADLLLLPGDLTDHGLPEEAQLLVRDIGPSVKVPILAVLGNHDHESGRPEEIAAILSDAGIVVLDGGAHEALGVGFAGVKGFAGGFGKHALGPWGEPVIKQFVKEAVDEALKLETALARLRTEYRIAVLHYAPVQGTVDGEPPEIYTYLGSSRLEEPLSRYPVTAVFHGHAHGGAAEARTAGGVPVYNVSLPLLRRVFPDRPPFRILEIPPDGG
jgi:Icc-related predicted phosphoesterase